MGVEKCSILKITLFLLLLLLKDIIAKMNVKKE